MERERKENKEGLITASGFFNGSTTKGNFDVQLKIKFPESQLANSIQFLAAIGKRMKMIAMVDEEKVNLGVFSIQQIKIDMNANNLITFKSNKDEAFVDEISKLLIEETQIVLKAKIIKE